MKKDRAAFFVLGVLVLLWVYTLWFMTLGTWREFAEIENYNLYHRLAGAFAHGQFYLEGQPPAILETAAVPYDVTYLPRHLFLWDASVYQGRYYIYWGPVPALVILLTGWLSPTPLPEAFQVYLAGAGILLLLGLLLHGVRRRSYPAAPAGSAALFLGMFGLSAPFLFTLGRPYVYEQSILFGQLFLLLGVYAAWQGVARPPQRGGWFALAGLGWGLAVGSRYNLALGVAVLVAGLGVWGFRFQRRAVFKLLLAAALPLALIAGLLLAYNAARFDNPLETGATYQLTIGQDWDHRLAAAHIPVNIRLYFWAPYQVKAAFPFLYAPNLRQTALFNTLPATQKVDRQILGLARVFPLVWLGLAGFVLALRRRKPARSGEARLLLRAIFLAGGVQLVYLLFFFYAANRYELDFLPLFFIILAVLGWEVDACLERSWQRWLWWGLIGLIGVYTAGVGLLTSMELDPNFFRQQNPALWEGLGRLACFVLAGCR